MTPRIVHPPECNPALTDERLTNLELDSKEMKAESRDQKEVLGEIKVTLGRLDERLAGVIWWNRGIGGSLGAGLALLFQWLRK